MLRSQQVVQITMATKLNDPAKKGLTKNKSRTDVQVQFQTIKSENKGLLTQFGPKRSKKLASK